MEYTKGKFTVVINGNKGYMEHAERGELGGLWFEGTQVVDYDGVFELPKAVVSILHENGYTFEHNILPEDNFTLLKIALLKEYSESAVDRFLTFAAQDPQLTKMIEVNLERAVEVSLEILRIKESK